MTARKSKRKSIRVFMRKSGLGVGRKLVPRRFRSSLDPLRRSIRSVLNKYDPTIEEQKRLDRMIGPLGYWDQMQVYQIELLKNLGLQSHHTLMDIGCGPLSGGLVFIPYLDAGNYYGIDVRESAIEEARRQVEKEGLTDKAPVLVVSSTFGADELDGARFDYIWCSQTTYHLDPVQLDRCLRQVASCLKPDGKFYADFISDPDLVTPGKHWFEFAFHFHPLEDVVAQGTLHGLTVSNLGRIEDYGYPVDWELKKNYLVEFRHA